MKKSIVTIMKIAVLTLAVMLVLAGCKTGDEPQTEPSDKTENIAVVEPEPEKTDTPDTDDAEPEDNGEADSDGETEPEPVTQPETSSPEEVETATTPSGGKTDEKADYTEEKQRIEELLDEVVELKSSFQSQLSGLEGQAANEYLALDESERTDDKKTEIALKYYNEALGLESQCDSRIDSICAELQLLLIKTDGDKSIATDVRNQYNSEKEALKSDYMSVYGDYLG